MAKAPFVKIYADNVLASTLPLSLAAAGAWFKIVLILSQSPTRGVKTMTMQAWARVLGASAEQAERVFEELKAEQAFNFDGDNSAMQITSRYIVRETKEMEGTAARVAKHRESNAECNGECNANVTVQKEEGRRKNKEGGSKPPEFDFYSRMRWRP